MFVFVCFPLHNGHAPQPLRFPGIVNNQDYIYSSNVTQMMCMVLVLCAYITDMLDH